MRMQRNMVSYRRGKEIPAHLKLIGFFQRLKAKTSCMSTTSSPRICSALTDLKVPTPYTLGAIRGILLLNHPPDFHEDDKQFLKAYQCEAQSIISVSQALSVSDFMEHTSMMNYRFWNAMTNCQNGFHIMPVLPPASGNADYATEGIHY